LVPYFHLPELHIAGPLKLDFFGVLSAVGTIVGAILAVRAAKKYAPGDDTPLREVAPVAVAFGLWGGHLMHLLAYHPEELSFLNLLMFWNGLSSMGGVLGALLGIFWHFHRKKRPLMPYLDALALGTAPGWAIARLGCFLVHDHPGSRTDFFLAVNFPVAGYGGPRHDLGLDDMLALIAISALLYGLARLRPKRGVLMGVLAVTYSVSRFSLDVLRAHAGDLGYVDKRYFGLTPAQYVVVGLFFVGWWLLLRKDQPPPPLGATPPGAAPAAPAPT